MEEKEKDFISPAGQKYHQHIDSKAGTPRLRLREVWSYRDLILLFTRRSFVLTYKQTILGPLWIFLRPLLSSLIHMLVFGMIAKLGTDGIPMILFYLFGNSMWGYFSGCVSSCSDTFAGNAYLFGKVYFPRLTVPVSNVLSALLQFLVQLIPGILLFAWYAAHGEVTLPGIRLLLVIPVLLILGLLGMGFGIIASSLTTRYRDLRMLVGFGLSLWMYATPVVYPLSLAEEGVLQRLLLWNPVTAPMELFRYAVFGKGAVMPMYLLYSACCALLLMLLGILIFHRVERNFMDTI